MEIDLLATLADVFAKHGPAAPAVAHTYSPGDFSIRFFLQLAIILLACRVVGWAGRKFLAQPQVVGEMIAGVILGPSLFGMLAPNHYAAFNLPTLVVFTIFGVFVVGHFIMFSGKVWVWQARSGEKP